MGKALAMLVDRPGFIYLNPFKNELDTVVNVRDPKALPQTEEEAGALLVTHGQVAWHIHC